MTRSIWVWPIMIVSTALGLGLITFENIASPIRPVIAFLFLFVCPGMAFVRLLRIREPSTELMLAIALSLALDTLVTEAILYAGIWSSRLTLLVLICISLIGAVLQPIILRFPVVDRPQPQ